MRILFQCIVWFSVLPVLWGQPVHQQGVSVDSNYVLIPISRYFLDPISFSVDPLGRIYILDRGRNTIQKITLKDTILTVGESYSWRNNAINQFQDIISPNGLDVYVADYGSNRIHRFDRDLNMISSIPQGDAQASMEKVFGFPSGVAIDRFGALFFIDKENKIIRKTGMNNRVERSFGGHDAGLGRLIDPHTIRISNKGDLIYVSDMNRIIVFDLYGNYITAVSVRGPAKPFVSDGELLMIAESCMVSLMDKSGINRGKISPDVLKTGRTGDCIIDIEINEGELYILTKHYLMLIKIRYQM